MSAGWLLESAPVHPTTVEAVADCTFILGTTARSRTSYAHAPHSLPRILSHVLIALSAWRSAWRIALAETRAMRPRSAEVFQCLIAGRLLSGCARRDTPASVESGDSIVFAPTAVEANHLSPHCFCPHARRSACVPGSHTDP